MKSLPPPSVRLLRDRSTRRPQLPAKAPPRCLHKAPDVLFPLFVRPFLLLPRFLLFFQVLYVLFSLPSAGRYFSFIDRKFSFLLFTLPRRLAKATTTPLVFIYMFLVVDNLRHFLRSQVCSCHRW